MSDRKRKNRGLKVMGIILLILVFLSAGLVLFAKLSADKIQKENAESAKALKVELEPGVNDLEYTYGQNLNAEIKELHIKADSDAFSEYVIYYPVELSGPYPVVVWGNGSGGTYKDYEAALRSLASYGFIVIGNDDSLTGSGKTIYETALFVETLNTDPDSIFFSKIDIGHIGAGGHSQGACGAVNAATKYERSSEIFKSLFTTSMPKLEMCTGRFEYWSYDVTQVHMPYFMTSGTGPFDADSIAPLASVQENFHAVPDENLTVMAIMIGADHNIVNSFNACGYMNAWFCYTLKGDEQAAQVFVEQAEITNNSERWINVQIK